MRNSAELNVMTTVVQFISAIKRKLNDIQRKSKRSVLKLFKQKDLLLKSKKCEFHKKEINFLNFMIEKNTIRMNSTKVRAVEE